MFANAPCKEHFVKMLKTVVQIWLKGTYENMIHFNKVRKVCCCFSKTNSLTNMNDISIVFGFNSLLPVKTLYTFDQYLFIVGRFYYVTSSYIDVN